MKQEVEDSFDPKTQDPYWLQGWSEGYFVINEKGNIAIRPGKEGEETDLYELVQLLIKRGMEPPILFRFDGIMRSQISRLYAAFASAIEEFEYKNHYQLAYPIKVNQQRHIVDSLRKSGKGFNLGLEVGSKPELVAVLSVHDTPDALLLCNGYKDSDYIELALLSRKIGRRTIIIIEQFYELNLVLSTAFKLGIEAEIGLRMKPFSKGSGKWASSGGDLAKFGLSAHEILLAVEELKKHEKDNWLKLLHFHIGSQITSIGPIKHVLKEATRMYTELAHLCPSMCFFDVGGGLGIDYEGSKTSSDSSMNYTVEEYARDVVYAIGAACREEGLQDPVIISESGRATVAHHSLMVTEVIDVAPSLGFMKELDSSPDSHPVIQELCDLYRALSPKNCLEILHDTHYLRESTINAFIQGSLSLNERAIAERVYKHLLAKIWHVSKELEYVPEEIKKLETSLLDLYFCNFSVFQSLPDSWAIQQLFPVMPIHRLNETPERRGIIVDLSCDSDGAIKNFIHPEGIKNYLYLHETHGQPYYLGIFLVGAYQEILGGLHNLFGDTNAIHVDFDENGEIVFKHQIEGDTISEVLHYVQYDTTDLMERLRLSIEEALKKGRLTNEESAMLRKRFKQALDSYTYLVV